MDKQLQLKPLAKKEKIFCFPPGAVIFNEGDPGDVMYLIVKGVVSIFIKQQDQQIELNQLHRGDLIGEIAVILNGCRQASALAKEETLLYQISGTELEKILASPLMLNKLLQMQAKRLCQSNRTLSRINEVENSSGSVENQPLLTEEEWLVLRQILKN